MKRSSSCGLRVHELRDRTLEIELARPYFERLHRAGKPSYAVEHEHDVVGNLLELAHDVARHHESRSSCTLGPDLVLQHAAREGIEARRGFVKHEQVRPEEKSQHGIDLLSRSARQSTQRLRELAAKSKAVDELTILS